jgi:hypothetical protein
MEIFALMVNVVPAPTETVLLTVLVPVPENVVLPVPEVVRL